jgi:class 3 adenylate cyclase
MAEFASAVEAVCTAHKIQAEIEARNDKRKEHHRMHFRIGINLGDVMVDGTICSATASMSRCGSRKNISLPGGLCIFGTVVDQVDGKIDIVFTDLGKHEVKIVAKPRQVHCAELATAGAKRAQHAVQSDVPIASKCVDQRFKDL